MAVIAKYFDLSIVLVDANQIQLLVPSRVSKGNRPYVFDGPRLHDGFAGLRHNAINFGQRKMAILQLVHSYRDSLVALNRGDGTAGAEKT
jgi:hypothetical protein